MLAYTAPTTVEEAVRALAGAAGVVKVLSGGTDLLVQLRSGRARPDMIVDIKRIPDMSGIREHDGAFVIGAAALLALGACSKKTDTAAAPTGKRGSRPGSDMTSLYGGGMTPSSWMLSTRAPTRPATCR